MFGSDILVCPKVFQKFIMPNEVVQKKVKDEVILEMKNNGKLPIYEVKPILPENYYEWSSKLLLEPGQYQFFL